MSVRVVSAAQAADLDARAIAQGIPSRQLMQAAGRAAAALVAERYPLEAERGVAVFAGPGNNGGDAWVVAGELARRGVRVRVAEVAAPSTADAIAEREAASALLQHQPPDGSEGVIVDGLLGTGARGAPRGAIASAIERIEIRRSAHDHQQVRVVALDVPSGVDATTGHTAGLWVRADLTVTFGSLKRGLLAQRDAAGVIAVVDIGLGAVAATSSAPGLVDAAMVRRMVPRIAANAHKGSRKRLLIVGGGLGMAGAPVLAARGALRSGIGMVKLCVARESIPAVQALEPAAMATPWAETDADFDALVSWAHVLLIGPGLGLNARARAFLERLLAVWRGPLVLDADALKTFEGEIARLGEHIGERQAVLTPHAVEAGGLAGLTPEEVDEGRFEIAAQIALATRSTVLLKGVPTVASDGATTLVSASGTPVLATGGSGDMLGGIVATLLAQIGDVPAGAVEGAAAAAWIHGRAAEIASAGQVRGVWLHEVTDALHGAWRLTESALPAPLLAELPAVGGLT
ncbi:MAG TPA: NAD(P)H-hydrate dehydratase [Gemmatimonadaceae bacterium]|nr:NAD(P)H-hydrate dehydratase [Gemmatimonadaceae bacterium]